MLRICHEQPLLACAVSGDKALKFRWYLQVDCLEERNREQSAGYNELALSLLDVVGALGAGGCFSVQHHAASLFRLVRALGQLLSPQLRREAPLKLRAAAAEALEKLAAARQLAPVLLPCLGERAHCFFAIHPSL